MVPVTDRILNIYGCLACILATWQWVSGEWCDTVTELISEHNLLVLRGGSLGTG